MPARWRPFMVANPVFVNELRQSAFRRRGFGIAAVLVIVGSVLALVACFEELRLVAVYAPLVALPIIVPAIASGAFAKEYEQQTWMDLYLTRLSNAQVVWGKFGAYLAQVCGALIAIVPACLIMLGALYRPPGDGVFTQPYILPSPILLAGMLIGYLFKLVVSACLAIWLTMICSRYSPNRRTALMTSYIAMGLYTALGLLVWNMVGSFDYRYDAGYDTSATGYSSAHREPLNMPGFMQSFHMIFSLVVGVGAYVLLWVSLSEQRGYRDSNSERAVTRSWQPAARVRKR